MGERKGYMIGSLGGRKIIMRYGYMVKMKKERMKKLEKIFEEKGIYVVEKERLVVMMRKLKGMVEG